MKKCIRKAWYPVILLAVIIFSAVCFLLSYRYDNKYTEDSIQAFGGVLVLDEDTLGSDNVIHLVEGWEFYRDALLTPADFEEGAPVPDAHVYIGQYLGFEAGDQTRSPHGQGSYRLTILFPSDSGQYMMELPEIFSAYRLYIIAIIKIAVSSLMHGTTT